MVLYRDRILLVRRGGQPSSGKWSLPGGLVELGETMENAIRRELLEECALAIDVAGVAGTLDRIVQDEAGRIRYHYVLIDFLAYAESDAVTAGSDAAEARWAHPDEMERLDVTDGLVDMVRRALALSKERNR